MFRPHITLPTPPLSNLSILDTLHTRRFKNYRSILILILIAATLPLGCAPLVPSVPEKPFSQEKITQLISRLQAQGDEVSSFVGVGKLLYREGQEESDSNLLVVGSRPFTVRLEVTHTWGKPLVHIVADKDTLSVLSLVERRFYRGPPGNLPTQRFFLFDLDLDSAWMILSGTVPILPHHRAISMKPYEITLYNDEDEPVETISFSSRSLVPRFVSLPTQDVTILLSKFKELPLGRYPSKIAIAKGNEHHIEIRYKSLQHNKQISKEVFRLNPPPDFEIVRPENDGQ
jgi:hypothetical protein